ncbi:MAG: hypothetical protein SF162_05760 [bacterium]|nr:hypothetical protein [bacterium]
MNPDALRGAFRIAIFLAVCGFGLAALQPPQSGEFVVSVCSGLIGMVMIGVVLLVIRLTRP